MESGSARSMGMVMRFVNGTSMGELSVDLLYGAYTLPTAFRNAPGELRIFAVGYIDERRGVVKTDNRPLAILTADTGQVRIGTYGGDSVQVFHTAEHGQFDCDALLRFCLGGVIENIYPAGTTAQFGYIETNFHF